MRLLLSHAGAFFTIATLLLLRNLLRAVGASFLRALPKSKPAAKPTAAHLLRRPAQRAEVQSQPGCALACCCQGVAAPLPMTQGVTPTSDCSEPRFMVCSDTSGGEAPAGQSIKQLLKQSKKTASQSSQAADAGSHSPLYLNTLKVHCVCDETGAFAEHQHAGWPSQHQ